MRDFLRLRPGWKNTMWQLSEESNIDWNLVLISLILITNSSPTTGHSLFPPIDLDQLVLFKL